MAIADTGATGHFLLPVAPAIDVKPTEKAISILLPDGERITSTHECELNIPSLPQEAKKAHIVPKLAHTSLVSIKMLCDAGCRVTYDNNTVNVFYKNIIIWKGHREPSTGLWVLPLNERPKLQNLQLLQQTETALSAYSMKSKRDLITYLHQCLFSPPKRTLLKAIHNNQLVTWPGLTTKSVSKYLDDDSPATDKGHMKRLRQGIRSTKIKDTNVTNITELAALSTDMNPPKTNEEFNHLFCYTGTINNKDGTIYVDLIGHFPIR